MSPKFAIRKLKISVSIAITSLIDIVVFSFRESVYVIFILRVLLRRQLSLPEAVFQPLRCERGHP